MEMIFHKQAQEDLKQIKKSGNVALQKKLTKILKDIQKNPFTGIAKPEALKYNLSGWWSRRLTDEHRVVYRLEDDGNLHFLSLLYHYK